VAERLGADRAVYVGPFASRDAAERAQAVLARVFGLRTCAGRLAPSPAVTPCLAGQVGTCPAPCAARIEPGAYRRGVEALLAFLDGDDAPLTDLAARRDALAAAKRFEAAARAERDRRVLEDVQRRRRTLGWVVARQSFVVLLPTADREAAQLYAVLGGRLAVEARIGAAADLLAAVALVRERFLRYQDTPLAREDLDGATILAAWLRDRGGEGLLLPLDGPEALAARLDELVVTVDDLRRRGPLPAIDGL
jgi:DNA polymerase-3 subunit epsilon